MLKNDTRRVEGKPEKEIGKKKKRKKEKSKNQVRKKIPSTKPSPTVIDMRTTRRKEGRDVCSLHFLACHRQCGGKTTHLQSSDKQIFIQILHLRQTVAPYGITEFSDIVVTWSIHPLRLCIS